MSAAAGDGVSAVKIGGGKKVCNARSKSGRGWLEDASDAAAESS